MHHHFFEQQLATWPLIKESYVRLNAVYKKDVAIEGIPVVVQCNPDRIRSTAANIAPSAIEKRPCFLCADNRPKEQHQLRLGHLDLLVNPFPVFPMHFTITGNHQPQVMENHLGEMLDLAKKLNDCVIFYNGPESGASAPDHFHFQAGNMDFLPLIQTLRFESKAFLEDLFEYKSSKVQTLKNLHRNGWLLQGKQESTLSELFDVLIKMLKTATQSLEKEPMMNVLSWRENERWFVLILPRKKHRPACFYETGDAQFIVSPASVEMGGVIVTVREQDYQRIDSQDIQKIYEDVCLEKAKVDAISKTLEERFRIPEIQVGIMESPMISFYLRNPYRLEETNETFVGNFTTKQENGLLLFKGRHHKELHFTPIHETASFELYHVTIGINFHWERKENQAFEGSLHFITNQENAVAINRISVEKYLTSVISSEMSAHASLELLKAHAVISRSWLLAQMERKKEETQSKTSFVENAQERIKWYDREDHLLFDVCADDHCQRYQGITKACTKQVMEAVQATWGEVLTHENELCDARFSKCCGGILETFENCWDNDPKPYLLGLYDRIPDTDSQPDTNSKLDTDKKFDTDKKPESDSRPDINSQLPDFKQEQQAENWILEKPESFCNTQDKHILAQVLNNYDQETVDFYRWKVTYSTAELSALIQRKSGIDFGIIQDLIPIERGVSGRITRLKIVGSLREMTVGKELEIRKILSESHLYSSAFVVRKQADQLTLLGAGWGHGVGLCQIGAAVMSEKGFDYRAILSHYYPNTEIKSRYQAR